MFWLLEHRRHAWEVEEVENGAETAIGECKLWKCNVGVT